MKRVMKENIWIPEEVTEGWSKNAQEETIKYVHFMYVKVSQTMGKRGQTSSTRSKWAIHTKLCSKKNCWEMTSLNNFTYTEE